MLFNTTKYLHLDLLTRIFKFRLSVTAIGKQVYLQEQRFYI